MRKPGRRLRPVEALAGGGGRYDYQQLGDEQNNAVICDDACEDCGYLMCSCAKEAAYHTYWAHKNVRIVRIEEWLPTRTLELCLDVDGRSLWRDVRARDVMRAINRKVTTKDVATLDETNNVVGINGVLFEDSAGDADGAPAERKSTLVVDKALGKEDTVKTVSYGRRTYAWDELWDLLYK